MVVACKIRKEIIMSRWARLDALNFNDNSRRVLYVTADNSETSKNSYDYEHYEGIGGPQYEWVTCPDYVETHWHFIRGIFCSDTEAAYWYLNLRPINLPPRTYEELQLENTKNIPLQDYIVVARVHDMNNFSARKFYLDINNTRVGQMREIISNSLGTPGYEIGVLACTNYWSPETVMNRYKGKNSSIYYESVNIFCSVLDGKKKGQNPPVGVSASQRQVLTDNNTRLSDMNGRVIVFYQNSIPRTPWSPDLIDIVLDVIF